MYNRRASKKRVTKNSEHFLLGGSDLNSFSPFVSFRGCIRVIPFFVLIYKGAFIAYRKHVHYGYKYWSPHFSAKYKLYTKRALNDVDIENVPSKTLLEVFISFDVICKDQFTLYYNIFSLIYILKLVFLNLPFSFCCWKAPSTMKMRYRM